MIAVFFVAAMFLLLIGYEITMEKAMEWKARGSLAGDGSGPPLPEDGREKDRQAMAEALREKERLAAEAAAATAAAAAGPSLDDIPADEMLEHIEAIREIMEFSDEENEIRTMCEQSNIPKSLVDVAVSDPDKLDELEAAAEG